MRGRNFYAGRAWYREGAVAPMRRAERRDRAALLQLSSMCSSAVMVSRSVKSNLSGVTVMYP